MATDAATNTDGRPVTPSAAAPALQMRDVAERDFPEVAAFIVEQINGRAASDAEIAEGAAHFAHLHGANPARTEGVPPGWLVRDASERLLGVMMNCPYALAAGDRRITGMMSHRYYVDASARGAGVGLFMRYAALGSRFPLFCTTAGGQSVSLWQRFKAYQISDQDHEMLGFVRPSNAVEEMVHRRTGKIAAARLAGAAAMLAPLGLRGIRKLGKRVSLEKLSTAKDAAALVRPPAGNVVSPVRDEAMLHWRHFSGTYAPVREVFACSIAGKTPMLIVTSIGTRGYRGQIRSLNVLDICGVSSSADLPMLAGALANRFKGRADVVTIRSQPVAGQRELELAGFRRRELPGPIGWCIDKGKLLGTTDWYITPGDNE